MLIELESSTVAFNTLFTYSGSGFLFPMCCRKWDHDDNADEDDNDRVLNLSMYG